MKLRMPHTNDEVSGTAFIEVHASPVKEVACPRVRVYVCALPMGVTRLVILLEGTCTKGPAQGPPPPPPPPHRLGGGGGAEEIVIIPIQCSCKCRADDALRMDSKADDSMRDDDIGCVTIQ